MYELLQMIKPLLKGNLLPFAFFQIKDLKIFTAFLSHMGYAYKCQPHSPGSVLLVNYSNFSQDLKHEASQSQVEWPRMPPCSEISSLPLSGSAKCCPN